MKVTWATVLASINFLKFEQNAAKKYSITQIMLAHVHYYLVNTRPLNVHFIHRGAYPKINPGTRRVVLYTPTSEVFEIIFELHSQLCM